MIFEIEKNKKERFDLMNENLHHIERIVLASILNNGDDYENKKLSRILFLLNQTKLNNKLSIEEINK